MRSLVIVSKGKNPYLTTKQGLRRFSLPHLQGRKVLIKPNAARLALPGDGVTTHPQVVAAAIDYLREREVHRIVIGESCIFGVNAREAFQVTGMKEISEEREVELLDLDQIDPMEIAIPEGKVVKKIKVAAVLKEFDLIISIPVMKTHMHTRVTLSIKNMKGLLWRREKARFHRLRFERQAGKREKVLDISISEMASVLSPHLAIIDGTVGMEGMGPAYGPKKRTGLIVIGDNGVSTDAVAAKLMGFAPRDIPHLKLAAEKGLGEIDLRRVSVEPKDYLKWAIPFAPPPSRLSILYPGIVIHDEGSCSACLSTLLVFLQDYHSSLTDYRLEDGSTHIGMGRNLNVCPRGTILIGNCTSRMKGKGVFIQGCPPVGSQIVNRLEIVSSLNGSAAKKGGKGVRENFS